MTKLPSVNLPTRFAKQAIGFILVLILYLSALPLFTAGPVVKDATAAPNDATIFTGQVIPAFIGGAYDPSEAFKKLAGLPVYVVAYDNWGQANKIKNNLAVRTQIRADGTFQAAGLPTAAHYGVYFPFRRSSNGAERSDGLSEGTQTAEFRWPELPDQIIDVFSYSFVDGSGITVKDQLGNDVDLGQLFTTTTTRVDKENNINVFPVVPVNTLKITVGDNPDASYEVYAQRIARPVTDPDAARYSEISPILNYPIIKGRTSPGPGPNESNATHSFQVYAPEGYYAITVWRTESNSATYKDWDSESPLNSQRHGFATAKVNDDWQEALSKNNKIPALPRIILWGTVTNEDGALMTRLTQGLEDLQVGVETYKGLPYRGRASDRDPNMEFYTPSSTSITDMTVWGIYMLAQNIQDVGETFSSDDACTYVIGAGYKTDPNYPDQGLIHSTNGPVRVNLRASKSQNGNASGYDSGIFLTVKEGSGPNAKPATNATIRVGTTEEAEKFHIPALTKSYTTDCLGQVHIPDSHLIRDQNYVLEIRQGNKMQHHEITPYPSGGYYNNGGQTVILESIGSSQTATKSNLYGLLPIAEAQEGDEVAIPGTLRMDQKLKHVNYFITGSEANEFRGDVGRCSPPTEKYKDTTNTCRLEFETPLGESGEIDTPTIDFTVYLPKPAGREEAYNNCVDRDLTKKLFRNCEIFKSQSYVSTSYDLHITAQNPFSNKRNESETVAQSTTLSVRSDGDSTLRADMNFDLDCDERFGLAGLENISFSKHLSSFYNRSMCGAGQLFIDKSVRLMDSVRNWLYIAPLTQEKGVVDIWNALRNVVNVTFVLMLIAIGLASILRYEPETWSPSILIPKLLIAIIIANFSLLIVQALIDVGNVLTGGIFRIAENILLANSGPGTGRLIGVPNTKALAGGAGVAVFSALAAKFSVMGMSMLGSVLAIASSPLFAMPLLSAAIGFMFSVALFFIGLIILLYGRYFVIWLMAMIAPLVWAAQVLPLEMTQSLKERWQNTLLAFIFMQPAIAFVLSTGLLILSVAGQDNTLISGFGVAIMGLMTLFAVFKVPGFMAEFMGEGFVSMEGLGQAPEGWQEKVFGKEGLMEEKFSAEKLAKGYRTATVRGSGKFAAAGQALFGNATGRLQQEERLNELLGKDTVPETPPEVKAKIELGKDQLVRDINTSLKELTPPELVGEDKPIEKVPSTHRGEAPDIKNYLESNPNQNINYMGDTMKIGDFVDKMGGSKDATKHIVGASQGMNTKTGQPFADVDNAKAFFKTMRTTAQKHAHATS